MSRKILISCGDPNGIGPEISVKALKKSPLRLRKKVLLLGDINSLKKAGWSDKLCSALNISCEKFKLNYGYPEASGGLISFKAFSCACRLASNGFAAAVVTAPVSKEAWLKAGVPFMGHTDYLEKNFKINPVMSFHAYGFNSFLITEHISLRKINCALSVERIKGKVLSFSNSFGLKKEDLIVFSGLNPHCGENGFLGGEEKKIIIPAMKQIEKAGFKTAGPFNPEDVFSKYFTLKAKAAVFMYHDQLLAPLRIKYGYCVHATWGLPFIRTSPSHGCAFDIAGKNKADETSMLSALKFAFAKI
ncbi:MAG: hypothetical protein GX447_06710 [Elusimicrobia bacterium]|nr:hypothetical protein [Elusimicrobiota bacterium]